MAHTRRDTATALEPTLIRVISASRVGAGLLGGRSQVDVCVYIRSEYRNSSHVGLLVPPLGDPQAGRYPQVLRFCACMRSQVIVTALDGVRRSISAGSGGEAEAKAERAADVPMDDASASS